MWEALRQLFDTSVRTLIRPLVTSRGGSAMAYYRRAGSPGASALPSAAAAEPALVAQADPPPAERDGLDRLFLGDA